MRSAAQNFVLLSSSEILSKGLGFLTTLVIARRAGVQGLGEIGFVVAVYTYFTLLANPGYDMIGARDIAHQGDKPSHILQSIFILKFWSSVIAFLALIVFCACVPFSSSMKQLLVLQGLSLLTIPFSFQFFFRGGNQMNVVAVSRLLQSSLYFIAVYGGVQGRGDLIRVPLSFGASTVLGLLPLFGTIRRHISVRQFIPWERLRSVFVSAVTIGAASICVQIYLNLDTVLLGFFRTEREVGLYTSAYKIVTLATTIPVLIFTSYLPSLAQLKTKASGEWKMYVLSMTAAGLFAGICVALFAPIAISLLYGAEYRDAALPLRILAVDIIAVFVSMTFAQPLLLLGKEKQYLSLVAWSAGLNLVLNLFMIPWLGMTGAALTTVGAESVVAYRSWRIMKSVVHSTYTREMIELTAIAGCSFLLGSLCKAIFTWNLIIAGVSFIVIYAVLTLLWMFRQRKAMTEPV